MITMQWLHNYNLVARITSSGVVIPAFIFSIPSESIVLMPPATAVFSATVNNRSQEGIKYYFFVYPSGIMDSVQIMFDNNDKIESEPLLLKFKSI